MPTLRHDTWADTLNPPGGFYSPAEVQIHYSGGWHGISVDVNEADGITITRGRPDEAGQADPARCTLTLRNPTGTYSPRNPASPLYGLIGRNTPLAVWIYVGGAWHLRFEGEVTTWPQTWGVKGSGQSMAPIEANGVTRRLGQGAGSTTSPLYRGITSIGPSLRAYWPCEDADGATSFAPAVGVRRGAILGAPTFAAHDTFTGSKPVPKVGGSRWTFPVGKYPAGPLQFRFITNIPGGTPDGAILARLFTSGTIGTVHLIYSTGGWLTLQPFDRQADPMTPLGPIVFNVDGRDLRVDCTLTQVGGTVNLSMSTVAPGATVGDTYNTNIGTATFGTCTKVEINPAHAALGDFAVGHVTVESTVTTVWDQGIQLSGYNRERATTRLARLAGENGLTLTTVGDDGRSQHLGPQPLTDLLTLMQDAADTDGGVLFETRGARALTYRTPGSIAAQTTADVTIPYTDNLLIPFEPVDDDAATRNRVTVTREGGTSATVEETTGPLSTLAPPDGVGVYDTSLTLSLGYDAQTRHQAGWRLHLGTVDEARWPAIGIDLAHPTVKADTTLRAAVLALDIGDRLDVTGLPPWLPPDPVQAVVQGYTESIDAEHYRIVFNCTPFRPWRVARWEDSGIVDRWSNTTTTLAEDLTTTETGVDVQFTAGPRWTVADGAFDVMIGGERMTVTAVTGTSSPQTFTVTRSVNGVEKAHSAGAAVTLADPVYYGF